MINVSFLILQWDTNWWYPIYSILRLQPLYSSASSRTRNPIFSLCIISILLHPLHPKTATVTKPASPLTHLSSVTHPSIQGLVPLVILQEFMGWLTLRFVFQKAHLTSTPVNETWGKHNLQHHIRTNKAFHPGKVVSGWNQHCTSNMLCLKEMRPISALSTNTVISLFIMLQNTPVLPVNTAGYTVLTVQMAFRAILTL